MKRRVDYKKLAMGRHGNMEEIAKAGEAGKPAPELLKMTSDALEKCVACHQAWQIKAEN